MAYGLTMPRLVKTSGIRGTHFPYIEAEEAFVLRESSTQALLAAITCYFNAIKGAM